MQQYRQFPLYKKLITKGAGGITCALVWFYIVVPYLLYLAMSTQRNFRKGGGLREIWKKIPIPFEQRVYLFNVSNPDEVTKGAKPIISEVGPFVYESWGWKTNLADRDSDDSFVYQSGMTNYYSQEKSGSLTGKEYVTIPNIIMLGAVGLVKAEMPGVLSVVNQAMMELFKNPKSVYMTVRVIDLLYEGININCSVKQLSTKSICTMVTLRPNPAIVKYPNNQYKFSMLGGANNTPGERIRSKRGTQNFMEAGLLMEYKDKPKLSKWLGAQCNEFKGLEGMIPAYLTKEAGVTLALPEFCRSLTFKFHSEVKNQGIPVYRYGGSVFGDVANNPDEHCFCNTADVPKSCPAKGTYDLSRCVGLPLILSQPHFLNGDPKLVDGVIGLQPNPEVHESFADVIPDFGAPVGANIRIQFNIAIAKTSKIGIMKALPKCLHPIAWLDQVILLPPLIIWAIYIVSVLGRWLLWLITWLIIARGCYHIGKGVLLWYRQRGDKRAVTPELLNDVKTENKALVLADEAQMIKSDEDRYFTKPITVEDVQVWARPITSSTIDEDDDEYVERTNEIEDPNQRFKWIMVQDGNQGSNPNDSRRGGNQNRNGGRPGNPPRGRKSPNVSTISYNNPQTERGQRRLPEVETIYEPNAIESPERQVVGGNRRPYQTNSPQGRVTDRTSMSYDNPTQGRDNRQRFSDVENFSNAAPQTTRPLQSLSYDDGIRTNVPQDMTRLERLSEEEMLNRESTSQVPGNINVLTRVKNLTNEVPTAMSLQNSGVGAMAPAALSLQECISVANTVRHRAQVEERSLSSKELLLSVASLNTDPAGPSKSQDENNRPSSR